MSNIVIAFPALDNAYGFPSGADIKLRFYYTGCVGNEFIASDNTTAVMCGTATGNFYREVSCTLIGGQLTIPTTTLVSTDDSNTATVLCSAQFFVNGASSSFLFSNWIITATLGTPLAFAALWIYNQQITPSATLNPAYLTAPQIAALITTTGVPRSRTLYATAPLRIDSSGSADLTTDRTLTINQFTSTTPGIVAASGGGTTNFLRADGVWASAGGGGGGGDVSSNTTTSVDGEIAVFDGAGGKTIRRATGTGLAQITAGVLSAGTAGTLSVSTSNAATSPHTHAITSSSNPGAAASLLASDSGGMLSLTSLLATSALYLRDTSTGFTSPATTIVSPLTSNSIRTPSFTSGLIGWNVSADGNAEFANVDVRGAIRSSVFLYNQLLATAGTFGVFKSAAKLRTDVVVPAGPTYGTTTVNIDCVDQDGVSHAASQLFVSNDILRIKDGLAGDTWFRVQSASDQTTFWRYVAVIMAGSNNITYRAGLGVADYGPSGQGFIIQTADAANSPYLQMATHSATFTSNDANGTLVVTPQLRLGNLNGSYGFASDVFGLGTGQYGVAGKSWVIVDPANGVRIGNNTTVKIQLDAAGNASFTGSITAASGNVGGWTISSNALTNSNVKIAAGVDIGNVAGTGEAWFGKGAAGYYGAFLKGTTAAFMGMIAGSSTVGVAGRPYFNLYDGTRYRVVIGELNTTSWDGVATNSLGMKVWDSSGNKLVEFSDAQNKIGGWTISATTIASGTSVVLDSSGSITAGSGNTIIDSVGMKILCGGVYADQSAIRFMNGSSPVGQIYGLSSGSIVVWPGNVGSPPLNAILGLYATGTATNKVQIASVAASTSMRQYMNGLQDGFLISHADVIDTRTLANPLEVVALDLAAPGANVSTALMLSQTRNSAVSDGSGAALDFKLKSSTTSYRDASRVATIWTTAADASRASAIVFQTVTAAGALTERARIGVGVVVGAPTGGDKGAGTANFAADIYKNNTAYTNPDYVLEHWATGRVEKYAAKDGAAEYTGLMPLAKLKRFVRENYHLPRFGQEAGHGLFAGSDALLTAVEEAYLYIFQLEERIHQLEGR